MKAPRNRTIDISVEEGQPYLDRCIRVEQPAALGSVLDRTILEELREEESKVRAMTERTYDLSIDSSILGSEETALFIRDFILKKDQRPKWEKK